MGGVRGRSAVNLWSAKKGEGQSGWQQIWPVQHTLLLQRLICLDHAGNRSETKGISARRSLDSPRRNSQIKLGFAPKLLDPLLNQPQNLLLDTVMRGAVVDEPDEVLREGATGNLAVQWGAAVVHEGAGELRGGGNAQCRARAGKKEARRAHCEGEELDVGASVLQSLLQGGNAVASSVGGEERKLRAASLQKLLPNPQDPLPHRAFGDRSAGGASATAACRAGPAESTEVARKPQLSIRGTQMLPRCVHLVAPTCYRSTRRVARRVPELPR